MIANHIDDASTVDKLQPIGDLPWAQPSVPESSTVPLPLESRRERKQGIKALIFSAEGQVTEAFSHSLRLFALLPDGSMRELSSKTLPLPLNLANVLHEPNIQLDNSTIPYDPPLELEKRVRHLFDMANEEVFEDGMESEFSRSLVTLIEKYQGVTLDILTELILGGNSNPEVASEALRWVGHIEDPFTHRARLRLLEHSLFSPFARIRDGAILGLASMDDPKSITAVERAIEREDVPELRDDMIEVLEQLRQTQSVG